MGIELGEHQKKAIEELKNGGILCGGTGSGKSRTALAYIYFKELGGDIEVNGVGKYFPPKILKRIYIITTARKRDTFEWEDEALPFLISDLITVDSWNNIQKYKDVQNSCFIFDEQRVIGYGAWTKNFLKIIKHNKWILLTATPGDTWSDYIPVFIANGFYKNKTDFIVQHVIYNPYTKYKSISKYVGVKKLLENKQKILTLMNFEKHTKQNVHKVFCDFDKDKFNEVLVKRWNVFEDEPIQNASSLCFVLRKVVNSNSTRRDRLKEIFNEHKKIIVFYNFNYEREIILDLCLQNSIAYSEWNGFNHQKIPSGESWMYIVHFSAGEAWNCIQTDTMVLYSQNHSYRSYIQAFGRIDRLNTPFTDLHYYLLLSNSKIDLAIQKALNSKKDFNEKSFLVF